MSVHRLRRLPSIEPTEDQCFVFVGMIIKKPIDVGSLLAQCFADGCGTDTQCWITVSGFLGRSVCAAKYVYLISNAIRKSYLLN